MRVSSINSVYCNKNYCSQTNPRKLTENLPAENSPKQLSSLNFRGKFGAILGGIIGGVATLAVAAATAPMLACLAGGGAVLGAFTTSAAEDSINGDNKKRD